MKKITFLTCGGTIDKDYGVGKGVYDVEIGDPYIKKILDKFDINYETEIIELLRLDSLNMKKNHREKIKNKILDIKNNRIIITHGTDTIIETGKALENINNKVIVLIGASRPGSMNNSDSELNIGYSLGILDILSDQKQYGVYIAMNGEYFNVNNVKKGEDGIFKKIN